MSESSTDTDTELMLPLLVCNELAAELPDLREGQVFANSSAAAQILTAELPNAAGQILPGELPNATGQILPGELPDDWHDGPATIHDPDLIQVRTAHAV